MRIILYIIFAFVFLAQNANTEAVYPDIAKLLQTVDNLRAPDEPGLKMDLAISTKQDPSPSLYIMLRRRGVGALVQAADGSQKGQKYLSTPKGYWIYVPNTRRAIRLTPLQLLRGQASVGDISRLRFSDDYDAEYSEDAISVFEDQPCWVINLTARSKNAPYASVRLLINQDTGAPVQAELLAVSGRKLKTAVYSRPEEVSGRQIIQTTTYIDAIDETKQTDVRIDSIEKAKAPSFRFRPQALQLDN